MKKIPICTRCSIRKLIFKKMVIIKILMKGITIEIKRFRLKVNVHRQIKDKIQKELNKKTQ